MPDRRIARAERPSVPPLAVEARDLADMFWNDMIRLVEAIAPDHPIDAEPLEDAEMFKLLERVAVELPVTYWDDPEALRDLGRLRKLFRKGYEGEMLEVLAKRSEESKKRLPDLTVAPGGPEWEAQEKRMSS